MKDFVLAVLFGLVPVAGAWAQGEKPLTPDQRGYVLKMTREMIKLGTTKDPAVRTELFLQTAHERVRELHAMHEAGKLTHHDSLGRSYDLLLKRGAAGTIESGAAGGRDMSAAILKYSEAAERHQEMWARFLSRVPAEHRAAILRAIETSRSGREDALRAKERGLRLEVERRLLREKLKEGQKGAPPPRLEEKKPKGKCEEHPVTPEGEEPKHPDPTRPRQAPDHNHAPHHGPRHRMTAGAPRA
jgi:hypothetical protein